MPETIAPPEARVLKSAHAIIVRQVSGVWEMLTTLRQDKPFWEFPGGCPEEADGGNAVCTLLREVEEEIGVKGSLMLRRYVEVDSKKFPGAYYAVGMLVASSGADLSLVLQAGEVADARWRSIDDTEGMIPFQVQTFLPVAKEFLGLG